MLRRFLALSLVACAACAPDAPRDGAAAPLRPGDAVPGAASGSPGASGAAYLVWSADSAGAETAWIDGAGRVVARRAGVLVAGSGGVWAWTAGKKKTRGIDCECMREQEYAEGAKCPTEADVATVDLADLLSGRRVSVMAAEPRDEASPPEQEAAALAGVGPYLFVETRSGEYACGAHGWLGVTAEVLDLSRAGARVEVLDSVAAEAAVERQAAEARALLRRNFRADVGDSEEPDSIMLPAANLYLTEVEAKWTPAGMLEVAYQITTSACYACGDGEAGSYSRSVSLPAPSVPPLLAEWTRAPDAVRLYWRRVPPKERAGWSRVDAPDPAAALARFRAR